MQARVEFFTKRIVNQALTRNAGKPVKRAGHQTKAVVGFPAWPRPGVSSMARRFILKHKLVRRELLCQCKFNALRA